MLEIKLFHTRTPEPIEVEVAHFINNEDAEDICDWIGLPAFWTENSEGTDRFITVPTPDGDVDGQAQIGDYIVKGSAGYYVFDSEHFNGAYIEAIYTPRHADPTE